MKDETLFPTSAAARLRSRLARNVTTVVLTLFALPSFADAVLELQTIERRGATPVMGTVEISSSGSLSRVDIASVNSNESGTMIFNSDISELVVVDNEQKEFYVIDQALMDNLAEQVANQRKQMEDALAEMPADQAIIARRMMNLPEPEAPPPPTSLSKTGASDTIGDHDCDYYDVMREGRRIRDICVTPFQNIREGKETAAALVKLGDFFESMRKAFAQSGGTSLMDRQQDLFSYMDELDGYPVLSRDYDSDGNVEYESRLVGSKHDDLAPEVFSRPADYRERSLVQP